MLSTSFDPNFLRRQARREGERRVRERTASPDRLQEQGVQFFPLPSSWSASNQVALLDESGYPFTLRNQGDGEDTALILGRYSYVLAPSQGQLIYGPRYDTIFYPGPISQHIADLNRICASTFGGRMPFRHADVASFARKMDARKILELISKNNLWAQIRSLGNSKKVRDGDIVLADGTLNILQTPSAQTADEIDADLYDSGIVLCGLSKNNQPKCSDIVNYGRQLYPGQAFIFTIPTERLQEAHIGDEDHNMIFTLGPRGRTLGLPFGIVFSTDSNDLKYYGLFISYRWNQPHREAVEIGLDNKQAVKITDPIPLANSFIEEILIPVGARLAQYAKGVVSANYPLPAGAIHSHVLFTKKDCEQLIIPCLEGILEGGENIHFLELANDSSHDVVDGILNRFFRR